MAEYEGRLPLYHVDLYRLEDAADALAGGLLDDRWTAGVVVMEWPDRMGDALPPERLDVVIDGSGDEPRTIRLIARGDAYERYLEARRMSARRRSSSRSTPRPRGSWSPSARPTGRCSPRPRGRPATATARRSSRPSNGSSASTGVGPVADRRDRRRHRARARSRGCASGSRPPRGSPTASAGRSSGSRRAPRCWRPRVAPATVEGDAGALLLPAGPSERLLVRDGAPGRAAADRDRPDARSRGPGSSPWTSPTGRRRTPSSAARRPAPGWLPRCWPSGRSGSAAATSTTSPRSCPEYVTLPRGVRAVVGEVEWSRDRP